MWSCNLREFVNYRHPDPRRVWKVGSELQSLPPFPLHPVHPVHPLHPLLNSFWLQNGVNTIKNGSDPPPKASLFPSWPQPGPEQAQGIDKGRQRAPEASKSEPKGIQWHAKVGQREGWEHPNSTVRQKQTQKRREEQQNKIYTQTPDQPPKRPMLKIALKNIYIYNYLIYHHLKILKKNTIK